MAETRIISVPKAPEGWRDRPDEFVYIGRANRWWKLKKSKFANPFKVTECGRHAAIAEFERSWRQWLEVTPLDREAVAALHGKTLVCWCAPPQGITRLDQPWCCHGQVLAQLAHELAQPSEAIDPIECTCDRLGHPCEVHDCRGGSTDA